jgi:HSP20 family molecular chaperone IbpA
MTRTSGASVPARQESFERQLGPFTTMRRFSEEIDRMFADFFTGGLARWPFSSLQGRPTSLSEQTRWPAVEVFERDGKLVVSSGCPRIEQGRHQSGSPRRPEGAKPETASASFEHGVIKIEMEALRQDQSRGRFIEVREGPAH